MDINHDIMKLGSIHLMYGSAVHFAVFPFIAPVLEPHLNMRQAAFVNLSVTADALSHYFHPTDSSMLGM